MVGRGTMDGVDIAAGQQVAEVVVALAVFVVVLIIDAIAIAVTDVFADVAKGDVLHVAATEVRPQVAGTHIPDTDTAHHDPPAGRGTAVGAEGRGGDQVGAGRCCCGCCLEKVSPIGTLFHGSALPFLKHGRISPPTRCA